MDAADLGGGENNVAGLVGCEEGFDGGLVGEVEVGFGGEEEVGEAEVGEFSDQGGAHQAAVAGDEDLGGFFQCEGI